MRGPCRYQRAALETGLSRQQLFPDARRLWEDKVQAVAATDTRNTEKTGRGPGILKECPAWQTQNGAGMC